MLAPKLSSSSSASGLLTNRIVNPLGSIGQKEVIQILFLHSIGRILFVDSFTTRLTSGLQGAESSQIQISVVAAVSILILVCLLKVVMCASKSEAMVLSRKKLECLLWKPQLEEFKYLGILFTNEGRRKQEINRWIGAASAVKWALYRTAMVKRELSQKAKLSIYCLIYVPILICGHDVWVMIEKTRSRIQAAKMGFLLRVSPLEIGVELLLLHIKRSQLRWLRHLVRMPPGHLLGEVFRARPTGRRHWGRPRTHWRDYVSQLAWEKLGIPLEELEQMAGEREFWASLYRLLSP
ncbi:hypothetical protein CCH79_00015395 [Gambusia affinis]|uniref:Uncharacterized protein n=1 Tax=Gambusia affinis TaxID=33528 RepID=A0A315VG97_GAMAF|nr:hypothetical protein CCH79_00015395 [Gambusia affinis]